MFVGGLICHIRVALNYIEYYVCDYDLHCVGWYIRQTSRTVNWWNSLQQRKSSHGIVCISLVIFKSLLYSKEYPSYQILLVDLSALPFSFWRLDERRKENDIKLIYPPNVTYHKRLSIITMWQSSNATAWLQLWAASDKI